MTKKHFKFTTLSFVLIYALTLYSFFDYYNSTAKYSTGLMTLFFNFLGSAIIAAGIGIALIFTRIILYKSKYKLKLKTSFVYLFVGLFNLNVSIIWLVSLIMEVLPLKTEGLLYMSGNFIVAAFIIIDIYALKMELDSNN